MADHRNFTDIDIENHNWFSNPLEWRQIDRVISLAFLTLLTPVLFSFAIVCGYILAPGWLNTNYSNVTLWVMLGYFLLMGSLILRGMKLRKTQAEWPALENIIVITFTGSVLYISWLTGTYFTSGLLLNFLGMILAMTFLHINKLKIAYAFMMISLIAFFIMANSGEFTHAPIFNSSTLDKDGNPVFLWTLFQGSMAFILSSLLYISLMQTERWWNREQLLTKYAHSDGLTGLTNRRQLLEQSELEILRTKRSRTKLFSLIILDIDHFKSFNDTHGHQVGDEVLVHVSSILSQNAREYDIVARYGGEEFVIVLPNTSIENAAQIAERLRNMIETTTLTHETQQLKVTSSFGVSNYTEESRFNMENILKAADDALYIAKENGRNRVEVIS